MLVVEKYKSYHNIVSLVYYSITLQLLLVEKDPTHMNTGIFACMGRTNDALQVSCKTSPHERFCPDRDSNPRNEGLSAWLEVKNFLNIMRIIRDKRLGCKKF